MKKFLINLYELCVFLPLFVLSTIATAITVMIGCSIGKRKYWSNHPPRTWSKFTCKLSKCKIKVIHKVPLSPKQSYIFVPNHQSYFDIFLIYGYLGHNIKWVQKQSLRKIPFVGKASEMAGHVFVDQSSIKSMEATIKKAKSQLEKNASIVIFPEGSRTKTGKINRFKRGPFLIALQMGLPIVPVTVNGAYDVMKPHTKKICPGNMELIVHEPISTENMTEKDIPQLMEKCHHIISESLWPKYK